MAMRWRGQQKELFVIELADWRASVTAIQPDISV